jgi:hypothetical protein
MTALGRRGGACGRAGEAQAGIDRRQTGKLIGGSDPIESAQVAGLT